MHQFAVHLHPRILQLAFVVFLTEAGPGKSLELCEAPKLDHLLAKQVVQHFWSIAAQAPQKEDTSVEEGVTLDLARVIARLCHFEERLELDLRVVNRLQFVDEFLRLLPTLDALGE